MTTPIIPLAYSVLGVGILVIIFIVTSGLIVFHKDQTNRLLKRRIDKEDEEDDLISDHRFLEMVKATRKDELERRNEFWSNSNQAIIVALITAVITALLFANKIEPDAGLPIITALSGFAIAKTVQSQKYRNERNE